MRKPPTLFQTLSLACDQLSVSFALNDTISENLESFYRYSTKRISFFCYCLEWAAHIESDIEVFPKKHLSRKKEKLELEARFQDFDNPDLEKFSELNKEFCEWTSENVLRGLDEFFQYYLLNTFELSAGLSFSKKEITASQVTDWLIKEKEFEKSGLKERLKILEKEFGLCFKYKDEILSINLARNVIAHHNSKVRFSDFNNNNNLEILWLAHDIKAKRRDKNKATPLHKLSHLDSNKYGKIETKFFSKKRIKKFAENEKINFKEQELREICQFYLMAIDTMQSNLCDLAKHNKFSIRDFKEYSVSAGITLIGKEI